VSTRRHSSVPVDWALVRLDFEATLTSVRALGRRHGVSYEAIRRRAGAENWQRPSAQDVAADPAVIGDVMALSRNIATRLLADLGHRKAGIEEIDRAAAALKNLAVAARVFGSTAPRAEAAERVEPSGPAPGKKELQRDAAAKIGKTGRYATPTPPKLVVSNN
jgi:hypothetical protein